MLRICYGQRSSEALTQNDDSAGGEGLGSSPLVAQARFSLSAASATQGIRRGLRLLEAPARHRNDGGEHNFDSHKELDAKRDETLVRSGFQVLRFWNSDVDRNLSGVLETIDTALRESLPHPAAFGGHPPPAGEG
jgi:hypothetical protein